MTNLLRSPFPAHGVEEAAERAGTIASIEDLHVSFTRGGQQVRALRGVSFDIGAGEIVGLVGESGSGKSVLGLTLLGLLPDRPAPEVSGRAMIAGVDMVTAPPESRRLVRRTHLGAVFQDPMTSLNPTMRVGRQVAEAAGSIDAAIDLLSAVGVPDAKSRARAFPHELSGGLRQRVMIAMALGGSPSLVIADEPTTALDVTVQSQILELIRRLCDERGTSFILVTHDLGVAAQVSDRIAVLYAGRMVELGLTAALLGAARHPYSRGLLRSRLDLDIDRSRPLITLPGEPPDPRNLPEGCAFAPRCPIATPECTVRPPDMESRGEASAVACIHPVGIEDPFVAAVDSRPWAWLASARTHAPAPAVVANQVTKSFPVRRGWSVVQLHALRGVDLTVNEGEAIALVGESGCGKSTLLRAIAGLHPIDGGSIEFGRGARPQMVFQDAGASLTPWLSVGEMVGERLREEKMTRRQREERVQETLSLVGLPAEVAAAHPAQLSGGQRQRVALARATVVPPEVLLCDEPTSALDVSLAATVLNLIGRLRRELGIAVIFVTHDLAAARIVADQVAVMYLGRIVEIGGAADVCASPEHPYTRALLAAVPGLGRERVEVKGEPASAIAAPSGCAFHPRCSIARDRCAEEDQLLGAGGTGSSRRVACWRAGDGTR